LTPKTRIILGVTGGIAAYKSPDLVRRLIERGADVLTLLRIYSDHETSLAAIESVVGAREDTPMVAGAPRPIVVSAGVRVARGFAKRLLPGSGLVFDGLASTANTENLSARTIRFYRGRR